MGANLSYLAPRRLQVRGVLLGVIDTLFSTTRLRQAFASNGLEPARVPVWLSLVFSGRITFCAAQDFRRFRDVAASTLMLLSEERLSRRAVDSVQTGHVLRHKAVALSVFDAADITGEDLPSVVERLLGDCV